MASDSNGSCINLVICRLRFASHEGLSASAGKATSAAKQPASPGLLKSSGSGAMQSEPAERRRQPRRSKRSEGGHGRAEPRGPQPRSAGSSEEEMTRLKGIVVTATRQKDKQRTGERGRGGDEEEEGEREGRDRGRGDGDKRRKEEKEARSRRAASEGGEESGTMRWRLHQLEKERLELTSAHNQELCRLQAELARLRAGVERGEAQRAELQYQLTASQRDAARATALSRDKRTLTERAAELQLTVEELQKVVDITRRARDEDQHALQQEVEERDKLIQNFSSENQRLHRLLQDQEEALEESERRMAALQKEREREGEKEAEANRRQADQLKYLAEREERSRREKEVLDQKVKSLESSIEAERAAHLESKFNSEIIQVRGRELEAALAAERSGVELLRTRLREAERALQRLQQQYEQCKSDLSVALEKDKTTTSDLTEQLEEEKRRHADTHTLLEQAAQRQLDSEECLKHIRETLQQHINTVLAKDAGNWSPPADVLQLLKAALGGGRQRLETAVGQVQDLLCASERLHDENQRLRRLTEETQQASVRLEEEVTRLRQESSDWSTQSRGLQAELHKEREEREERKREQEREREERKREKEREREEREREKEREREEREREKEREREERVAEVQKITDNYQKESKARLSFLYCVYQRLLAGCVLLHEPQSMLGDFTWTELCEVINEQVDQLTSDLRGANDKIAHLQSVCEKKSVCVRELQRSQECVLSRLEESARRREEVWSSQHTHTVTQLQACRSQCDSLRDQVASLELRGSSLTSDLSRVRGLVSRGRAETASFLSACALLAGALRHTLRRLHALSGQKALACRRLAAREALEEEVRTLAAALGGEEEEDEEEGRRRQAVRRWRRGVCVVLAVQRWRALTKQTSVLFRVERGGGTALCVCGETATATREGQDAPSTGQDAGDEGVCARWLRSKSLSSIILSSMTDLQGELAHTGSSPPDVKSVASSALSRLLDHLLDQSDAASSLSPSRADEDTLSGRLRLGLSRLTPPQPNTKALVSTLQQHFLLFSQRLHSVEVERRSLRLEVANLKRGLKNERGETCRTVPAQRFHSVCVELRQALNREQEAQTLIREQTDQLHTLQLRVNTHTAAQADTQRALSQTAQSLSEARQEVSRKERSLRILGKHLSGVQRERKQLEQRLQRVEGELTDAARRKDCLIRNMKAAETTYKEVREGLVQSRRSLSTQPRPLSLPREHLELSGAESIMGAPELAACQSFLSSVSQLFHTCSSRIDWLEQEVAAHRSHVIALRGELQDACLRDNQAYVPVADFPKTFPFADEETPQPVPCSDWSKEPSVSLSTALSQTNPAPSPNPSKPLRRPKTKEKKAVKKHRAGRR